MVCKNVHLPSLWTIRISLLKREGFFLLSWMFPALGGSLIYLQVILAGWFCSAAFSENTGGVASVAWDTLNYSVHSQCSGIASSLMVASLLLLLRASEILCQSHCCSRSSPRTTSVTSEVPWPFLTQEMKAFWGPLKYVSWSNEKWPSLFIPAFAFL